jgi:hypothetical protein
MSHLVPSGRWGFVLEDGLAGDALEGMALAFAGATAIGTGGGAGVGASAAFETMAA